ncbi:MAG: hypothetical protein KJP01_06675 [Gramella sp.]|nr:hypothetical protein [Christiangramia sp.]
MHFFIVNVSADLVGKTFLINWDEVVFGGIPHDKNNLLDHLKMKVNVTEDEVYIKRTSSLNNADNLTISGVKILGKQLPAISPATKLSNDCIFKLHLE